MAAAYGGLDVRDPAVSLRRVWVLLERLPPPGRQAGAPWSVEAELLALLADRVAELTYVTVKAAGGKAAKPKPLPRPPTPPGLATPADQRPRQGISPPPGPGPQDGAQRAGGWLAAAQQLAAIPGVVIEDEGGADG
jgi:hypothetical protein